MRRDWRGFLPATRPRRAVRWDPRKSVHGAHTGTSNLYEPGQAVGLRDLLSGRRETELAYRTLGLRLVR